MYLGDGPPAFPWPRWTDEGATITKMNRQTRTLEDCNTSFKKLAANAVKHTVSCWPLWAIITRRIVMKPDTFIRMTHQPFSYCLGYTPSCSNKNMISWRYFCCNYLLVKSRAIPSDGKLPKIMVSWNLYVSSLLVTVTSHSLSCKIRINVFFPCLFQFWLFPCQFPFFYAVLPQSVKNINSYQEIQCP